MKYIVVIIPKFDFYTVLYEVDFIDKNEYKTQILIIEVLETLGIKRDDFICDLCNSSL